MSGATIRHRRNTSVDWLTLNPILDSGEPGYEIDTGLEKRGDGISRWVELPYFVTEPRVREIVFESVEDAVAEVVIEQGGVSAPQFQAHQDSETPHPFYDDGSSFLLLYENAKAGS